MTPDITITGPIEIRELEGKPGTFGIFSSGKWLAGDDKQPISFDAQHPITFTLPKDHKLDALDLTPKTFDGKSPAKIKTEPVDNHTLNPILAVVKNEGKAITLTGNNLAVTGKMVLPDDLILDMEALQKKTVAIGNTEADILHVDGELGGSRIIYYGKDQSKQLVVAPEGKIDFVGSAAPDKSVLTLSSDTAGMDRNEVHRAVKKIFGYVGEALEEKDEKKQKEIWNRTGLSPATIDSLKKAEKKHVFLGSPSEPTAAAEGPVNQEQFNKLQTLNGTTDSQVAHAVAELQKERPELFAQLQQPPKSVDFNTVEVPATQHGKGQGNSVA